MGGLAGWAALAACTLDPLLPPDDLAADPTHDWDGDGFSEDEGDCRDDDPAFGPAAVEVFYDDVDQDCAGDCDHDADGDGVAALLTPTAECGSIGDCDDTTPEVSPLAEERCETGEDEDCDQAIDEGCQREVIDVADRVARGTSPEAWAGLVTTGHLLGGEVPDVVIGAQQAEVGQVGAVYLIAGDAWPAGTSSLDDVAWARLDGTTPGGRAGGAVVVAPRADGAAAGLLWVGAERADGEIGPSAGLVFGVDPVRVAPGVNRLPDVAMVTWEGTQPGAGVGTSLAAGDFDADGNLDLAVGAAYFGQDDRGAVYLVFGDRPWVSGPVGDAPHLEGKAEADELGQVLERTDLDGDGVDDLALGRQSAKGNVSVFFGPYDPGRWVDVTQPELLLSGLRGVVTQMGWALASSGDVDGDGLEDLVAGAPLTPVSLDSGGAAYLIRGQAAFPDPSPEIEDLATGIFEAEADGDRVGEGLEIVPDLDGDGVDELIVAGPGWSGDRGLVTIWPGGRVAGRFDLADAPWRLVGAREDASGTPVRLGASQAAAGDADGDGLLDLVIGSREVDDPDGGIDAGGVWRVPGSAFVAAPAAR